MAKWRCFEYSFDSLSSDNDIFRNTVVGDLSTAVSQQFDNPSEFADVWNEFLNTYGKCDRFSSNFQFYCTEGRTTQQEDETVIMAKFTDLMNNMEAIVGFTISGYQQDMDAYTNKMVFREMWLYEDGREIAYIAAALVVAVIVVVVAWPAAVTAMGAWTAGCAASAVFSAISAVSTALAATCTLGYTGIKYVAMLERSEVCSDPLKDALTPDERNAELMIATELGEGWARTYQGLSIASLGFSLLAAGTGLASLGCKITELGYSSGLHFTTRGEAFRNGLSNLWKSGIKWEWKIPTDPLKRLDLAVNVAQSGNTMIARGREIYTDFKVGGIGAVSASDVCQFLTAGLTLGTKFGGFANANRCANVEYNPNSSSGRYVVGEIVVGGSYQDQVNAFTNTEVFKDLNITKIINPIKLTNLGINSVGDGLSGNLSFGGILKGLSGAGTGTYKSFTGLTDGLGDFQVDLSVPSYLNYELGYN